MGLIQERIDLQAELAVADDKVDIAALESAFIAAAKPYSDRKGITRAAWREVGVVPGRAQGRRHLSRRSRLITSSAARPPSGLAVRTGVERVRRSAAVDHGSR